MQLSTRSLLQLDALTSFLLRCLRLVEKDTRNGCGSGYLNLLTQSLFPRALSGGQVYETTLNALKETKNESLWFNTNVKLANIYLKEKNYSKLAFKLEELHEACTKDGKDDPSKSTWLMEVYALEIQLCSVNREYKKLESIYQRVQELKAAVSNSRVMG